MQSLAHRIKKIDLDNVNIKLPSKKGKGNQQSTEKLDRVQVVEQEFPEEPETEEERVEQDFHKVAKLKCMGK
jgi:hypothetical protein